MVVCKVRKNPDFELQPCGTLLFNAYRTDFHKAVLAAGLHHLCEERVDGDGVCSSVRGLAAACAYIVCYRRKQSAFISQIAEHMVEQGDGSCLSVRAGDAHELEFAGRMSEEIVGAESQSLAVGVHYC